MEVKLKVKVKYFKMKQSNILSIKLEAVQVILILDVEGSGIYKFNLNCPQ